MSTQPTELEYTQTHTRVLQQKLFNVLHENSHWETKTMLLERQLSEARREIEELRSRYAAVQNVLRVQNQAQAEELQQQLEQIPDQEIQEILDCGCDGETEVEATAVAVAE